MRVGLYYGLSFLVLLVYGGQVCPFLESLSLGGLALPLAATLSLAFLLRQGALR